MTFKILCGWLLLFIGVAIIFWAVYSSYNIFTARAEVPEVFEVAEQIQDTKEIKLSQKAGSVSQEEIMRELLGEQIKELFPIAFLTTLFNLIAWSIFTGILIFAGSQISGLGIKLVRQ